MEGRADRAASDLSPVCPTATYGVVIGIAITRRKTYHFVVDPTGEQVFASRKVWECFQFLDDLEQECYWIASVPPGEPAEFVLRAYVERQAPWQS